MLKPIPLLLKTKTVIDSKRFLYSALLDSIASSFQRSVASDMVLRWKVREQVLPGRRKAFSGGAGEGSIAFITISNLLIRSLSMQPCCTGFMQTDIFELSDKVYLPTLPLTMAKHQVGNIYST